jgi:hypothetical protein
MTPRYLVSNPEASIANDTSPLPPRAPTPEEDDALLNKYPWIDGPITKLDYGYNVKCCSPAFPISAED